MRAFGKTVAIGSFLVACALATSTQACGRFPGKSIAGNGASVERAMLKSLPVHSRDRDRERDHRQRPAVVGMWITTYYIGAFNGAETDRFDLAIQQFSSDGNELMNSALVPPEVSNVCFGVWKDLGDNTFKLRHTGWDFGDPDIVAVDAIFTLDVTLTVSDDGRTYSGTYSSIITDLDGNEKKDTFVEGDVKGTRFEVS